MCLNEIYKYTLFLVWAIKVKDEQNKGIFSNLVSYHILRIVLESKCEEQFLN